MSRTGLEDFTAFLYENEKSRNTIAKYVRDVRRFLDYAAGKALTKTVVTEWKKNLIESGYKPGSINSMIASVNSYFRYIGRPELSAGIIRIQKSVYRKEEDELTREEYFRLLKAAEGKPRLQLIMQTMASTGIRVSELKEFTVPAVREGRIVISNKNKIRTILIPSRLRTLLLEYAKRNGIEDGPIMSVNNSKTINRSVVWEGMRSLCSEAGVDGRKVYPHNLRKLFAREFYAVDKNLAELADVLGHSSIETTRIYIMGTGNAHQKKLDSLELTK